ncbi:MAG: toll/interleukin-1 receptor domain-containing protein [Verrucomicrobia bacterium]|nr:toll/interleukin-1 receptor domain-containing protein [Verrucomicrobiota bacterium]
MNGSSAVQTTRPQLAEREWDKLASYLASGTLVPVIGPEALIVSGEDSGSSLYDAWGLALAERVLGSGSAPVPAESETTPLLYWMAGQVWQEKVRAGEDYSANDLAWDIDCVVHRQNWPIPQCLTRFAEIKTLPLYVSTTVDHLLVRAVEEARGVSPHQIIFTPRGIKTQVDLPETFPEPVPTVFQLFGATSSADGSFAKSEDDLIEFSWSLIDHEYAPVRLYDYFRTKTVLLLGCSFPDWLGRFFIHALKAGRDTSGAEIYFVSTRVDRGLEQYLRRRRAKIVNQDPPSFIAELHRRWSEMAPKAPVRGASAGAAAAAPPAAIKRGAVFISYAREDRKVASKIREQLEAEGVDTWMDDSGLEPGAHWEEVIEDNIRQSAFFLPVISQSLDPSRWGDRRERFLLREWQLAVRSNSMRPPEDRFLCPVCADDTSCDAAFVRPFRAEHWTRLSEERLPPEFIQSLRDGIRRFRRAK